MPVWKNSLMTTAFYDETAAYEDEECIVRVESKSIEVGYDDDNGNAIYRGRNDGSGHFELICPEREGHATLHMFENGKFLEGHWAESGERGFWRIKLCD